MMDRGSELGNLIRLLRKNRGLTLDNLSDLTGLSKSNLCTLETRLNPRPSASTIHKIAQALGVSVDFLIAKGPLISFREELSNELIRRIRNLSKEQQDLIGRIVDSLAKL
jgi:transcriptional regulator with XRE-family HTH domain